LQQEGHDELKWTLEGTGKALQSCYICGALPWFEDPSHINQKDQFNRAMIIFGEFMNRNKISNKVRRHKNIRKM
jgi:hypothetical protein